MTDMRDPKKVLEFAGDEPVAVMNRDKVVGYFTPENGVADTVTHVPHARAIASVKDTISEHAKALDYLKDK